VTQEEFNQRWADLLAGRKTPAAIAVEEQNTQANEPLPAPLANPVLSERRTIDDLRRQALANALKGA
jgi:hypothetical protein